MQQLQGRQSLRFEGRNILNVRSEESSPSPPSGTFRQLMAAKPRESGHQIKFGWQGGVPQLDLNLALDHYPRPSLIAHLDYEIPEVTCSKVHLSSTVQPAPPFNS